jgi:hypothetical protein
VLLVAAADAGTIEQTCSALWPAAATVS